MGSTASRSIPERNALTSRMRFIKGCDQLLILLLIIDPANLTFAALHT